jgi:hypothetical protein
LGYASGATRERTSSSGEEEVIMSGATMYPNEQINVSKKRTRELASIIEEMTAALEEAESGRLDGTNVESHCLRPLGTCQVRMAQLLIDVRQDLKFDQFAYARKLPRAKQGEEN